MRIEFIAAAALVLVGLVVPCSAQGGCEDCGITFTLNSSYAGGGMIDGTITFNSLTDMFTAADLTVSGLPSGEDGTLNVVDSQGELDGMYGVDFYGLGAGSSDGDLALYLPTTTLAGYIGSSSISDATNFSAPPGSVGPAEYIAASGSLTDTAVAPEPGSLLLLGTGLLGFAVFWRRRLVV